MLRACLAICAAVLLLLAAPPARGAPTNSDFEEGVKLLKDMEDSRALEAFNQALQAPNLDRGLRARIHLHMGIAYGNLLNRAAATQSFRKALTDEPGIALPASTSPKIGKLFEQARLELQEEGHGTTPPPPPPPPPPEDAPPPGGSGLERYVAALTVMGVAVAAGATGIALGALSRSAASTAADTSLTYGEAKAEHDAARQRALGANILFGITGAAAVTSGVLFYFAHRKGQQERATSAAILPGPSGVVLQLEGRY